MKDEEQPGFLYHSSGEREEMRNYLPLALLLAALVVGAVLFLLDVRMSHPVQPRGEGRVYYRNDELIHFQIRQRTPLPLNLPYYADPARQESAAAVEKAIRAQAEPLMGPAFDFLFIAPDSIVLGETDLLELPPASSPEPAKEVQDAPEEVAPAQVDEEASHGEEVQP